MPVGPDVGNGKPNKGRSRHSAGTPQYWGLNSHVEKDSTVKMAEVLGTGF